MEGPEPVAVGSGTMSAPRVLAGGAWTAASYFLPTLYVLILSVVAARYLGVDGMGAQSFIAWASMTVANLGVLGIPVSVTRFVSEYMGRGEPGAVRSMIAWAWKVEAVAAAGGFAVMVGVGLLRGDLRSAWVLAAVGCAIGILHTVPFSALMGLARWKAASAITLLTGGIGLAATVAVLEAGGGIAGMFAVEAVISAANTVWVSVLARRALGPTPPDRVGGARLRRAVLRYTVLASVEMGLALIVLRRSEFFFLDRYATAADIAWYSVAFAAVAALARLPEGLSGVAFPAVATLHGAGEASRIAAGFGRAVRLIVVVSLPLAAGVMAVGPEALRLVYGEGFRGAGAPVVWLAAGLPSLALFYVTVALLQGLGRQRAILSAFLIATVVNIALDFAVIPPHGAAGAAAANLGGQVTLAALTIIVACRIVPGVAWRWAVLARSLIAAALTGATGLVVVTAMPGFVGLALAVAAGAGVYAASALVLKVLPRPDAEWLAGVFGGRAAPAARLVRSASARR